MNDVTLYGHLTFDRIFEGFNLKNSVGSIGNVWKCLNSINSQLRIKLAPTELGEALILVNRNTSERTSIANLSLIQQQATIHSSKWNHILYLNELIDTSFISNLKGTVSADICKGKALKDISVLEYIDFLFISDEDINMDIELLLSKVRKAVILHSETGSTTYTSEGNIYSVQVEQLQNINVLGAGDMLAACFINEKLNSTDIEFCITNAHYKLTEILKSQLNEN